MRGRAPIVMAVMLASTPARADDGATTQPPHHSVGPWVLLAVGATLFTAGFPTEILASFNGGGADDCLPNCPRPAIAIAFQVVGGIGIGVGAGLLLAALVWRVADTQATIPRVSFAPMLTPRAGGATLRVSF